MKVLIHILPVVLSILCCCLTTRAQNPWKAYIETTGSTAKSQSSQKPLLVQISSSYSSLKEGGFEVLRKLDEKHAIVKARSGRTDFATVAASWQANNQWKLGPGVDEMPSSPTLFYLKSVDPEITFEALRRADEIEIVSITGETGFLIRTTPEIIRNQFLHRSDIVYIGIESQNPTAESRVIDMNLNVNTINMIHNKYPLLNGEGMVISIQEQQFKVGDIDLTGRSIPSSLASETFSDHATEMATVVAGAGNSFINGKGVATAASITSSDFSTVLPNKPEEYENLNVHVQNHSYGTGIENFYGIQAEAFDQSTIDNPTLLHVISSGNQGLEIDTSGSYEGVSGFANLTGNFKMAKNPITVGSVDTVGRSLSFVSKGPAHDGRVKPELVAYSTAGSSNSAALVSGVVTLLQQAYREEYGSMPSATLIKALLINSARDVSTKAVDFTTGYGNVDAHRSLGQLKAGTFIASTVSNGETKPFTIEVPSDALNLKVTLVWSDPAAMPNSNIALVNDLDLRLTSGESWLPWILDTSADANLLAQPASRGEDHLNNVEQITLDNPHEGEYTIEIIGYDVEDTQSFAIAYQWDKQEEFTWSYPTANDNMPYDGETVSYFRWNSTLSATNGILEYSTNGGESWQTIASDIDLKKGYYRWNAPLINSTAIARILAGGMMYHTEPFTISRPERISVGFDCADSVALRWPQVENATGYTVFTLGDKYMQPITITTDTSMIIRKGDFSTPFFSIQPRLAGGDSTIRYYTIDYRLQGTGCFLTSFFPVIDEDNIYLNLQLSSTYGIDKILFEKKSAETFIEVKTVAPVTKAQLKIHDPNSNQGPNTYRVRILFKNGTQIMSEEALIYFLTDLPFLVFPNPVRNTDELKIFTKAFEAGTQITFSMMNSTGKTVLIETINSDRDFISLTRLEPGLYLYTFRANGVETSGKLVVQ